MNEEPLAYTVPEASRRTRIGRNHIYASIASGELKILRVGRRLLIPAKALDEWLEARTVSSANAR